MHDEIIVFRRLNSTDSTCDPIQRRVWRSHAFGIYLAVIVDNFWVPFGSMVILRSSMFPEPGNLRKECTEPFFISNSKATVT